MKRLISSIPKIYVLRIYSQKKTSIVRLSTVKQWLIFIRKIQPFKLTTQVGKYYLLSLYMGPVITLFADRKFNDSLKVPASLQGLPDSPS